MSLISYFSKMPVLMRSFLAIGISIMLGSCKKDELGLTNDQGKTFQFSGKELEDGVSYGSIYYSGSFNAFTDLSYFNGKWIVVFREGTAHADNKPGRIKVVTSKDGRTWKVENVLSLDSVDLRDPKLVVDTLEKQIFITFFGRDFRVGSNKWFRNYVVNYTDSLNLNEVSENWPVTPNYILWRWTVNKSQAYSMAYRLSSLSDTTTNLCLTIGESAFKKRTIVKRLNLSGQPTETTLRFDKEDKMYLMIRADGGSTRIGLSNPPYTDFNWLLNGGLPKLASPNFLLRDSMLIITGRDIEDQKFKFFVYNMSSMSIIKQIVFPGGYEVGYGGMSMNPVNANELWISYYSIENGGMRTNIYLVKMDLKKVIK